MIESIYWKEELRRIAQSIRRVSKPARWSERSHCIIERDLMIGFFILRRLIELHKVSTTTSQRTLNVFAYKARGKKVTKLNGHDLPDAYEMEKEVAKLKTATDIANQFIHAYTSLVERDETRNWSDVYVVSDYDKNDLIWRVPLSEVRDLFLKAADDYPRVMSFEFNEKCGDYDVKTN